MKSSVEIVWINNVEIMQFSEKLIIIKNQKNCPQRTTCNVAFIYI
jgi:hypothetical protein